MPYDTIEAPPPIELLEIAVDDHADVIAPPARRVRPWMQGAVMAAVVVASVAATLWLAPRPGRDVAPVEVSATPHGLEGFAEVYVATYLTASGEEGAAELRRFYAAGPDGTVLDGGGRWVARTAAVAVAQSAPGQWGVTVAADVLSYDGTGYRRNGIQHYVVGVVEGPGGLAATSLPARTPAPPPAALPAATGGTVVDDPAVGILVAGFLEAYLTGTGELRAFASEGVSSAVPDAFAAVSVSDITTVPDPAGLMRLRVRGTATDDGGNTLPIEYHLVVAAEGGTMRIAAVTPGPAPPIPTG